MSRVEHIQGHTWHGRKGETKNDFRYGIDYVCLDAEAQTEGPRFFPGMLRTSCRFAISITADLRKRDAARPGRAMF